MAKRKTAGEWGAFLRELRKSGNLRVAAFAAGMDPGTVYDKRARDERFAARLEAARARGLANAAKGPLRRPGSRPGRSPSPGKPGEDLVARTTKHGTQMVRAAPGRWSDATEAAFRAALRLTGCVRAAARACGVSTNALYERRKNYPQFAAAWAADLVEARRRLPELLSAAAIANLDPELERKDLPRVDVDQAIAICRIKGFMAPAGAGEAVEEPPIEEVRASIMRKLDAIEAHEARKAAKEADGDSRE